MINRSINEAGSGAGTELSAIDIVQSHLERQIDEISAIAILLGTARKLPDDQLFGTDIEFLDEVMLRRLRSLASSCQNAVTTILQQDCSPDELPALETGYAFEEMGWRGSAERGA